MATINSSIKGSLEVTLQGYRAMLERQLGLKDVEMCLNDTQRKEFLRKRQEKPSYPYSYVMIQDLRAQKDTANGHSVARNGWVVPNSDVTSSTTVKSYMWPVALGTELHVIENKPAAIMKMAEQMIVLSMTNALNFSIELMPGVKTMVRAEIPDTVSIPLSEADNTSNPGASEITLAIALYSWIGFAQDVNRISGTIGQEFIPQQQPT
jgi:hypothetical protein